MGVDCHGSKHFWAGVYGDDPAAPARTTGMVGGSIWQSDVLACTYGVDVPGTGGEEDPGCLEGEGELKIGRKDEPENECIKFIIEVDYADLKRVGMRPAYRERFKLSEDPGWIISELAKIAYGLLEYQRMQALLSQLPPPKEGGLQKLN
jgi:hypothetical protein